MNTRRKSRRNTLQNIAIVLLTVSAILLFLDASGIFSSRRTGLTEILSGNTSAAAAESRPTGLTDIAQPVRIAVTGAYGRYGDLTLTTSAEEFSLPGSLLKEALGSAGTFSTCTESDFRSALSVTGIYCDFCADLPLSVLGGLLGADVQGSPLSARRTLLANTGEGIELYISDGETFSRCTTRITTSDLAEVLKNYQLGNASFAFELDSAKKLAPYSLFPTGDLPSLPQLTESNPLSDSGDLLSALAFNPRTQSRYPESNGTQVVLDGKRTLQIQSDGDISYQSGGTSDLKIAVSKKDPDTTDLAVGCFQLLSDALGKKSGDASLFLQSIQQNGDTRVFTFGYQVSGTPIRYSDETPAARVTLSGTTVSSLQFRVRSYTASPERESLLLPLRQALAIASSHTGAELAISYADSGSTSVPAQWQVS